jgi:hypothetical protein
LTEWRALLGTIATVPARAICVTPSIVTSKLTLDHLIDFFLGVEVFVNGRSLHEVVVRECHAGRVEIPARPAGQTLDDTST